MESAQEPHAAPAPPLLAAGIFAATSLLFFACLYVILPLARRVNLGWFACFNFVLVAPVFALLGLTLWGVAREGSHLHWADLRDRLRLRAMDLSSWIWTAALSVFMFGGRYADLLAAVIGFGAIAADRGAAAGKGKLAASVSLFIALSWLIWLLQPLLTTIPLHSMPNELTEFFQKLSAAGSFMGIPTRGQWWIPVYYALFLLFGNIAGEELWWRGYLLPRQELASGSVAWVYNGLFWASFHLFLQQTLWDLVRMIPTCCALAFVAQHRKNTWPGIIAHTAGNLGILIAILRGVVS